MMRIPFTRRPTAHGRGLVSGLLACIALSGCGGSASDEPLSVLLVTLDTTRADALSVYSNDPRTTPHLTRLAEEGIVYENASTVTPVTLPSHASMLTGLYPPRHSLRDNGLWPLPSSAVTAAEQAAGAGIQTAAFVAAVVLDEAFGLDQGFDSYVSPGGSTKQAGSRYEERDGADVVDDALRWLDARDHEREFFLWVHLFDAHGPHFVPKSLEGSPLAQNPYHAEVAYMDAQLGRLFDALRADGTLDETLVLVVGDHGEAFGENGETSHGAFVYQSTMHVPFLLRDPSGHRAATRSKEPVSVVDVFPTITEALGVEAGDVDGLSLFRREIPLSRGVYMESYVGYLSYGWSPLAGWLQEGTKYLHSAEPEFYDLYTDPVEARNLAERDSTRIEQLKRAIADVYSREALARDEGTATSEELMENIRNLGYASLAGTSVELPHPLEESDRPSPLSMRGDYRKMLLALSFTNTDRHEEAEVMFRELIRDGDENHFARNLLAVTLMQQGRFDEAITYLREVIATGPQWPDTHTNLAVCLAETGDLEAAERSFRDALLLAPGKESALEGLAIVLRRLDRPEEASEIEASIQ